MPTHNTIEDAIDAQARGRVKRQAERDRQIEYHSIDELIAADRYAAGKTAATKPQFGLRMTKIVPPGGG